MVTGYIEKPKVYEPNNETLDNTTPFINDHKKIPGRKQTKIFLFLPI